ncbi:MAG: SpoIIE family protein phosphatase [Methanobacteriaceae archaeon]|nr:SpoIIE family protein phosphatase [Methanobacteriaceae archaeon]
MVNIDYYLKIKPLKRLDECGDTGFIKRFNNKLFFALIDGAGHSRNAHKIAVTVRSFLEDNYQMELKKLMEKLDQIIKGSNGAVVSLCTLDLETGNLKNVGVGDITLKIYGQRSVELLSKPGVIGYVMPNLIENNYHLQEGDILVMYTDGVRKLFNLNDYPETRNKDSKTLANYLISQFGRKTDDSACLVLKYNS